MNKLLTWHRHRRIPHPVWWLSNPPVYALDGNLLIRTAAAIISTEYGHPWVTLLPSGDPGPVSLIRCRNLREAMDCARRWAEYRGFEVAERFPETIIN